MLILSPNQAQGSNESSNQAEAAPVTNGPDMDPNQDSAQEPKVAEMDVIRLNEGRDQAPPLSQAPAGEVAAIDEEDRMQDDKEVASQRKPPQKEVSNEDIGGPFLVYDHVSTLFSDWISSKDSHQSPESTSSLFPQEAKGKRSYVCLRCEAWFTNSHRTYYFNSSTPKNYSIAIPAEVSKQGIPYPCTNCLRNILEIYLREKKSKSPLTFYWDFQFLTTMKPSQMFSTPSNLPLLPRDTVASFSQLVRDIIPAVIKKNRVPSRRSSSSPGWSFQMT